MCLQGPNKLLDCSRRMSDCPDPRHRLIYSVLKARISSVFSKIPDWFARDVIIPFLVTRLTLLLVARLSFSLVPLPVVFPSAWEIGVDGNRHAVMNHISATT